MTILQKISWAYTKDGSLHEITIEPIVQQQHKHNALMTYVKDNIPMMKVELKLSDDAISSFTQTSQFVIDLAMKAASQGN